jgi:hypothetical protein
MTSEEALKFIREIQGRFKRPPRTKAQKLELQKYLALFTDAQLKAVGRRVQGDLMARPAPAVEPEELEVGAARPSGSRKKSKPTPAR